MPFVKVLTSLLTISAAWFTQVLGHHHQCAWKAGSGSPLTYGYSLFCIARYHSEDSNHYHCDSSTGLGSKAMVADWNKLKPNVLEIGETRLDISVEYRNTDC